MSIEAEAAFALELLPLAEALALAGTGAAAPAAEPEAEDEGALLSAGLCVCPFTVSRIASVVVRMSTDNTQSTTIH